MSLWSVTVLGWGKWREQSVREGLLANMYMASFIHLHCNHLVVDLDDGGGDPTFRVISDPHSLSLAQCTGQPLVGSESYL